MYTFFKLGYDPFVIAHPEVPQFVRTLPYVQLEATSRESPRDA